MFPSNFINPVPNLLSYQLVNGLCPIGAIEEAEWKLTM